MVRLQSPLQDYGEALGRCRQNRVNSSPECGCVHPPLKPPLPLYLSSYVVDNQNLVLFRCECIQWQISKGILTLNSCQHHITMLTTQQSERQLVIGLNIGHDAGWKLILNYTNTVILQR